MPIPRATARVAPTEGLPIGFRRAACPHAAVMVRWLSGGGLRAARPTDALLVVRRGGALPLPRATARVAPTEALQGVRYRDVSPSHGFAVPAPFRQGGQGDGGADCHSRCAHRLRNDRVFYKGGGTAGRCGHRPLRKRYKRCNGRATARVAPTHRLPIGFRRGRRPRRPASVIRGAVGRAKNKIAPGVCQGRCSAP